jgi:CRP/FNR family cyclic AMP-dependent transcriptional regulator
LAGEADTMTQDIGPGGYGKSERFDYHALLAKHAGATIAKYENGQIIYAQGDPADAVFYIVSGMVKVAVISEHGKEGIVALLGPDDFFGEGSLDDRPLRTSTLTATSTCEIVRLSRALVVRMLGDDPAFSRAFLAFLLGRTEKLKADLIDQLFNSSEKRLARILLTLANSGMGGHSNLIALPITQDVLANMVGTTRSRINQFMNKFRKLGYIDYNGQIQVHNSLLNIILIDSQNSDEQQRRSP